MGLRLGCLGVLRRAKAGGVPMHIVSVNWSSELVRAALQQPAAGDGGGTGKAAAASRAAGGSVNGAQGALISTLGVWRRAMEPLSAGGGASLQTWYRHSLHFHTEVSITCGPAS